MCTDACKEGFGWVLIQENYILAYEYKKLKEHEQNYATHDLELASIIHALKMWWHYLIGRRFLLMLDNISLKYLFGQQNLNARQVRWMPFLRKKDFEIKHTKGKEKKVVDDLIRLTKLLYASRSYESDLENKILNAENFDKEYQTQKEKPAKNEKNE